MEISPQQLADWKKNNKPHLLIDIREKYEFDIANIGGKHIAMGDIVNRLNELPANMDIVIHCKSGNRAEAVCYMLLTKFKRTNVYNLKGGYMAYRAEIDTDLPEY